MNAPHLKGKHNTFHLKNYATNYRLHKHHIHKRGCFSFKSKETVSYWKYISFTAIPHHLCCIFIKMWIFLTWGIQFFSQSSYWLEGHISLFREGLQIISPFSPIFILFSHTQVFSKETVERPFYDALFFRVFIWIFNQKMTASLWHFCFLLLLEVYEAVEYFLNIFSKAHFYP